MVTSRKQQVDSFEAQARNTDSGLEDAVPGKPGAEVTGVIQRASQRGRRAPRQAVQDL
jgi:hypothetical protein